MLTVTPEQLREYLAVLPQGAFQVEIKSGDFALRMNLQPPAAAATDAVIEPRITDKEGNLVPNELLDFFPQLRPQV